VSVAALAALSTSDGADPGSRRVHIVQGEYDVSRDPNVVLTTLLGSCVAACIHDPVAGVGGMNHFLLPESDGGGDSEHMRYGVNSMELLINGILKLGGRRDRLHVWLFGGARMFDRLTDIGSKNAEFAQAFIKREEMIPMGGSLGGTKARRIQFWPVAGRARQLLLNKTDAAAVIPVAPVVVLPPADAGSDVELF
jgi:chemotaxis protein CheD